MTDRSVLAGLSEGEVVHGVALSLDEAAALNATRLVMVEPGVGGWTVRAAYAVGALTCGDLEVRVAPKVGAVQVLRLLARAHDVRMLAIDDADVSLAADHDLTVVLAELFAHEAATAMAEGPLRGYRTEEQTLPVVRGRLRIRDQQLRRYGQLVPLEVVVDEWTADTDENRRLRAATRRLLMLGGATPLTRRRLLRLDRQLAGVQVVPGSVVPDWAPTRLNHRLHGLLGLADLVLAQQTVEHRVGPVVVRGWVLSMATLFERLVTQLMTETARGSGLVIDPQRSVSFDLHGLFTIRPDITLLRGRSVVAVVDVKYKLLDESGRFPNADAYQLVAYCTRLGLSEGHLVYAAGDRVPADIRIQGSDVRLFTHVVDPSRPLDLIAQSLGDMTAAIGGCRPMHDTSTGC